MDPIKLQKKFKLTKKEVAAEALKHLDKLNRTIDNQEEHERVMNLKDLIMRNLKVLGIITEENKGYFLMAVFHSVIDEYWTQKTLPAEERAIFTRSYTDRGLKREQLAHYKKLLKQLSDYKKVMKEWWKQRSEEEAFFTKPDTSKHNGKKK